MITLHTPIYLAAVLFGIALPNAVAWWLVVRPAYATPWWRLLAALLAGGLAGAAVLVVLTILWAREWGPE